MERKRIGAELARLAVLFLVILSLFPLPAFAFDPVTHGYIGQETAKVVEIEDKNPNPWIFENGCIYADVMHLDDSRMHDNKDFTWGEESGSMGDKAENLDELTWAAAFLAHQVADDVWVEWCDDHGVPRGGPYQLIEAGYEFLFAAYALIYESYALPLTFPFYPELIKEAYNARTGKNLSDTALGLIKNSLWAAAIGEVAAVSVLWKELIVSFEFPWGPAATVRKSFKATVDSAKRQSVMPIESRWYEFKKVGTFTVGHMNESYNSLDKDEGTEYSDWPNLSDGWERVEPPNIQENDVDPWAGYSWQWTSHDKSNPNIQVDWHCWARNNVNVTFTVWAKRKIMPEEVTVPRLELPQSLIDAIAAKRAETPTLCPIEPLLTKPDVTLEELETRQQELIGLIGEAVQDTATAIQEGRLAYVSHGAFTWKDEFVDLIAGKSMEIECPVSTINALEERAEKIRLVQHDLTISSTTGGSVTSPGEGTFTYDEGTVVNLVAEAEDGYQFVNWTGDVGTIADVEDATTTITMDDDYEITANFEEFGEAVVPVCFIATAAYGSPMAKEVEIMRQFWDEYLLTNPLGQALAGLYYRVGPPIAEFITEHPSLKPVVRAGLVPAVAMSAVAVNTTPAEKMAIAGLLVLVSVALAAWATRRRGRGPEYS